MAWTHVVNNFRGFIEKIFDFRFDRVSLRIKFAAIRFSSKRADYYLFLADIIEATGGTKSLRDIFKSDVARYGNTPRGILAAHWAKEFDKTGGSIARTFSGTIPDEDIGVLNTLQEVGGEGALENALRDLAMTSELINKAKGIVIVTTFASLVVLLSLITLVVAMPSYTVPKILSSFSILPLSEYPERARSLVGFADMVASYWPFAILAMILFVAACAWSVSNTTGGLRKALDKYFLVWGMYRDFQSIRFLSFLAAVIRKRGTKNIGLRTAIEKQIYGASRWKKYHIDLMLKSLESGVSDTRVFGTGIMDKTMEWYLADLIDSRGLDEGLLFARDRLKDRVLKRITVQSTAIAWAIMLISLFVAADLMFWHLQVIDDLRRALQLYVS